MDISQDIAARRKEQVKETEKYNEILNSYLRTYFSNTYADNAEMALAFETTNKHWVALCKKVNSTSRLINLKKDTFKNRVELTIKQIKENELHKK